MKLAFAMIATAVLALGLRAQTQMVIDTSDCETKGYTPGVFYSCTLKVTGGTPPYVWKIVSGTPPLGLSLDPNTGIISGIVPVVLPPTGLTVTAK